jgi:hypothetical protein
MKQQLRRALRGTNGYCENDYTVKACVVIVILPTFFRRQYVGKQ